MTNIEYRSADLVRYFSRNRIRWDQFYDSERKIIGQLSPSPDSRVLDIGCGCGGLGLALKSEFGVENYTGVEINAEAAAVGRNLNSLAKIYQGDILKLQECLLAEPKFDLVFSLSCIDWNIEFEAMLQAAWSLVSPGGYLIATFRITDQKGCRDMARSFQYINYQGEQKGELASYVVLDVAELMNELKILDPSKINMFGYWGTPSFSAVTPYDRLCFIACSIQKRVKEGNKSTVFQLDIPSQIRNKINESI